MTSINRRTALARMAAVPAALAAGFASSPEAKGAAHVGDKLSSTSPDAELIRLGAEFERLYDDWKPLWREMTRLHHVWGEAINAKGLSFDRDMEAIIALDEELGGAAACDRNNERVDQLQALTERIRAIRPTTIAGLVAHARACRFGCLHIPILEMPRDRWDLEFEYLHDFLAEIETLAANGGAA